MLKFRSGTHGLNQELGRQRGRKESAYSLIMNVDTYVLLECPVYSNLRHDFV